MKRLVTMRFIRIKRRGLAQVRESYRLAYENYLAQVAHREEMLAARHISNKDGDDDDVPKVRCRRLASYLCWQSQRVRVRAKAKVGVGLGLGLGSGSRSGLG